MRGSKYRSKWLDDNQIELIIIELKRRARDQGPEYVISTNGLIRLMGRYTLSGVSISRGRRLSSLINVLKHHKIIHRLKMYVFSVPGQSYYSVSR